MCIGGPLHGRQAPLEHEDAPEFQGECEDSTCTVTYRRRPIDIFVDGTSVSAYVYAQWGMTGRDIAKAVARLLNTGRLA